MKRIKKNNDNTVDIIILRNRNYAITTYREPLRRDSHGNPIIQDYWHYCADAFECDDFGNPLQSVDPYNEPIINYRDRFPIPTFLACLFGLLDILWQRECDEYTFKWEDNEYVESDDREYWEDAHDKLQLDPQDPIAGRTVRIQ